MTAWAKTSIRWLLRLAGTAILVALAVGPVTAHFRFADKLRPYAEGIFSQSGPIDVVFLGTSRVRSSIMAHDLEALLEKELQRPVVIYDLGKSARGADADYLLLKETLSRSSVRLVVAEYTPASQKNNHFFFLQAATWRDLVEDFLIVDGSLSRLASSVRTKLSIFMTELTGGRGFRSPAQSDKAATFDFTTPRGPNEARLRRAIAQGRLPMNSAPLGLPENIVQDTYTRKTIEMVRAQGGDVVLMSIPGLNQKALANEERERIARFFGTDVIGLSDEELANFDPHRYSDEKHHGWLAINLYIPLVAKWLSPKLPGSKTSSGIL